MVRRFDEPLLGCPRVGERSALEAEQLRLEERLGDRGAVDVDERTDRPPPDRCRSPATSPFPVPVSPRMRIGREPARRRSAPAAVSALSAKSMRRASTDELRRAEGEWSFPRALPHLGGDQSEATKIARFRRF